MDEILIIKPSSFGDIIHGLQVAQSLKKQLPDCRITWVASDAFKSLVEHAETVDATLVMERYGGCRKFFQLLRGMRKKRYDCLIDMQGLARSALMTAAARAKRKIGRSDAREGAALFYREKAPLPNSNTPHALEILMEILPLLGLEKILFWPLRFKGVPGPPHDFSSLADNPIVIFPDSRRREKIWGGFSALTGRLLEENPDRGVIWAGNRECADSGHWPKRRFFNLTGKTGVEEIIALLGKAALVVANDSGPVHLAAALKIPVLGLFGPTSPLRFGPYPARSPLNHVLQAPRGDLNRLATETVYAEIRKILANN